MLPPLVQVAKKRWGRSGDLTKKAEPEPEPPSPVESEASVAEPTVVVQEPTPTPALAKPEPVRQAAIVEDEEDIEKKRLADSLFATEGRAVEGGSARSKPRGSRAKKGRAYKAKASEAEQPDLLAMGGASSGVASSAGDLLGDFASLSLSSSVDMPPPGYAAALAAPSHPPSSDMDLLGGFGLDQPTMATSRAPAASSSMDLLGGLDLLSSSSTTTTSSAMLSPDLLQPSATSPSADLLGAAPASAPASTGLSGLASLALPSVSTGTSEDSLPPALAAVPHEAAATQLNADAAVALSWQRVWQAEVLDVIMYVKNISNSALDSVVTRVDAVGGLVRTGANAHETRFSDRLGPGMTKRYVLSLTATHIKSGMALKGQVTYSTDGRQRNMHYTATVQPKDVLRAWPLQTAQFGQLWQSTGSQRSMKVQCPQVTSAAALNARMEQAHVHCVQIIGMEVIYSGKVRVDGKGTRLQRVYREDKEGD